MDLHEKLHKLRNPLNTISMNAELAKLLMAEEGESSSEAITLLIERIIVQCGVCAELIADMESET